MFAKLTVSCYMWLGYSYQSGGRGWEKLKFYLECSAGTLEAKLPLSALRRKVK